MVGGRDRIGRAMVWMLIVGTAGRCWAGEVLSSVFSPSPGFLAQDITGVAIPAGLPLGEGVMPNDGRKPKATPESDADRPPLIRSCQVMPMFLGGFTGMIVGFVVASQDASRGKGMTPAEIMVYPGVGIAIGVFLGWLLPPLLVPCEWTPGR